MEETSPKIVTPPGTARKRQRFCPDISHGILAPGRVGGAAAILIEFPCQKERCLAWDDPRKRCKKYGGGGKKR